MNEYLREQRALKKFSQEGMGPIAPAFGFSGSCPPGGTERADSEDGGR